MIYNSKQMAPCYFPPILGNGDLTFPVDCEGAVHYAANEFENVDTFDSVIYRAGRRAGVEHDRTAGRMISFGKLWFDAGSTVENFEQELREQEGLVRSVCWYENGAVIATESFILPDAPVYCVRKTVLKADRPVSMEWRYRLEGYDEDMEKLVLNAVQQATPKGGSLSFAIWGQDLYQGELHLQTDRTVQTCSDEQGIHLSCALAQGESWTAYLYLDDDMFGADPAAACKELSGRIAATGYEGLKKENAASWQQFYERCYVRTSDETLNQIYTTALYHLRCYTTRWSIPVGLNNRCWHGKFFAFDEYYSYLGLLGANQLELAKRVPDFRLNVCLDKAIVRQTNQTDEQARFCWETTEYGEEMSPVGFWYDHIFHMSVVAVGAYEYYEYSQDREFLARLYRMIRACAKFFTLNMIYRQGDRVYIGRCSDLERLGSSVENAFMTTCGAIRTLEVAAAASQVLGIDEDYRAECLKLAQELRDNLPAENGMYIPHPDCKQKSVGVFAGKFPFNVLADDDPRMLAAWADFLENGAAYGNMYKTGQKLSPWYACWEAEGFARAHMGKEAYKCLKRSYESVGVFGEMFEINEPARRLRPWFTTASGIYLSAVNEMLVESDGETIRLLPACPLQDVAFKLAVKGGAVLEAEVAGGKLVRAKLLSAQPKKMKLVYKDEVVALTAEA